MTDDEIAGMRLLIGIHQGEWWTEKLAAVLDEVDSWQGNYDGAMSDLDYAIKQMTRLVSGETTVERTKEWLRLKTTRTGPAGVTGCGKLPLSPMKARYDE